MRAFLLFALSVLLCGCSREVARDPGAVADSFFKALAEGDARTAYRQAGFRFQAEQSLARFELRVKELGLIGATPVQWTERTERGQDILFRGEIEKPVLGVSLTVGRQDGNWKVMALTVRNMASVAASFSLVGASAAFSDTPNVEMPKEALLQRMVLESLLEFNQAVRLRSFANFYNFVSKRWQDELTEKRLETAFQSWIDAGIDFSQIQNLQAIFSETPRLTSQGVVVLSGFYNTEPYRLLFNLQFIYELPRWRLCGMKVSLAESKAGDEAHPESSPGSPTPGTRSSEAAPRMPTMR